MAKTLVVRAHGRVNAKSKGVGRGNEEVQEATFKEFSNRRVRVRYIYIYLLVVGDTEIEFLVPTSSLAVS